jgi:hypothetical protein
MQQYRTGAEPQEYRHHQASDVRRQVEEAPRQDGQRSSLYPKEYHNNPPQPLSARGPYSEYPIRPSPRDGAAPSNYTSGCPGPVRAFYNNDSRSEFDVGYHDSFLPPRGPRNGREHPNSNYSLASYHPGPDYTDNSTYRRSDGYGRSDY